MNSIKELKNASFIILILSIITSGVNYIFQLVMGRMLTVEDFGTMNTLLAMITIFTLPMGVISILIAKYIAENKIKDKEEQVNAFIFKMGKYIGIAGVIITAIIITGCSYINSVFAINDIVICILLAITIGVNIFIPFISGILQGFKMFFFLGCFSLILAVIKLGVSVILVESGYRIKGTIIGLLVANIIAGIGSYILIKHNLKRDRDTEKIKISGNIIYIKYIWVILIINVCLAYFSNIDMLIVKKYFSTKEAGIYSTSILFSKLMLYIPNSLATAMFPIAIEQKALQNLSTNILKKSVSYVLAFSLMCYIGMNVLGQEIIKILFGNKYMLALPYVKAVLIMAIPIGVYTIIINFSMVINKMKLLLWTSCGACLISYGVLSFYHDSIYQVVWVLTIVNTLVVLTNLIHIFRTNRNE